MYSLKRNSYTTGGAKCVEVGHEYELVQGLCTLGVQLRTQSIRDSPFEMRPSEQARNSKSGALHSAGT